MMISEVSVWINILVLKYLVDWIENDQNIWNGVILGLIFIVTMLTAFIIRPFYFFYAWKLSILINKGISATLMKKMMNLSQKSLAFASSGKLVTLITSELHMIEKSFWFIPAIIVCPITLLAWFAYFGVIYYESSAISFVALVILIAAFLYFVLKLGKLQYYKGNYLYNNIFWLCFIDSFSDLRLKYITDIINGIKTIKAYCWEKIFYEKVEQARENQLKYIFKSHVVTCISLMFIMSSGYLMSIILFGYHWGVGRQITYSTSAISLTMIIYISFRNLIVFFNGVKMAIMLKVVWGRADEIMQMDDFIQNINSIKDIDHSDSAIICNNLNATWGFQVLKDKYTGEANIKDKPIHNLIDISFEAEKSDLICVIGSVGSGKSTLLAAIINELNVVSGELKTKGRISYVEQEPFIMSQSVKENILFGEPLDEERLQEVVSVCWLDQDIELFEQGIDTIIGERGIDISGGQKARISLARAVYSNADKVVEILSLKNY